MHHTMNFTTSIPTPPPFRQAALEITQAAFGAAHPLTSHRLLRLAAARIAQGRGDEAPPLLAVAVDVLSPHPEDPALHEAQLYLGLLRARAARTPADVAAADDALLAPLARLAGALGPDSMNVRVPVDQHARLAGAALDDTANAAGGGFALAEALFRQHVRLQEARAAPLGGSSAELGVALYQLAVAYYAHDMLADAGAALHRAAETLRQHFPEGHDFVAMCAHRAGMVCAAGRDARAAKRLLQESRARYVAQAAEQGGVGQAAGDHPLVHEADFGLAMAE